MICITQDEITSSNVLDAVKWTFAKTYAKTAPHEYIVREQYPDHFQRMAKEIKEHGIDEPFAYIPPATRHNVKNTGSQVLEYVWVVAPTNGAGK